MPTIVVNVPVALARFGKFLRREAHRAQAVAYLLGYAAYQVTTAAGGFEGVRRWTWRDWAGHLLVAAGPPVLFLLRGQHVPLPSPPPQKESRS